MLHVVPFAANTFCLRQDKCATSEAPFLYLLLSPVAGGPALLIDTGDRKQDDELLAALEKLLPKQSELLVAHTHPHSDHVAGDGCIMSHFGSRASIVTARHRHDIDLGGGRLVEVIPAGRGHSDSDVCFLDASTRLLFTGDVLYPGYLYVRRLDSFRDGIQSLWQAVRGRYDWSVGAHVEMNSAGQLYKSGEKHQVDEMVLQQPPAALGLLAAELRTTRFANGFFALTPHSCL